MRVDEDPLAVLAHLDDVVVAHHEGEDGACVRCWQSYPCWAVQLVVACRMLGEMADVMSMFKEHRAAQGSWRDE